MSTSKFLTKKASETIDLMIKEGLQKKAIADAKGFFVSDIEDQPDDVIVIGAIEKQGTEYFICQQF